MAEQKPTWRQRTSEGTTTYQLEQVSVTTLQLGDLVLDAATPARSTYLGRVRQVLASGTRDVTWLKWETESFNGYLYADQTVWKATKL